MFFQQQKEDQQMLDFLYWWEKCVTSTHGTFKYVKWLAEKNR